MSRGAELRQLRELIGIKQGDVARAVGLPQSSLSAVELEGTAVPWDVAHRIMEYLMWAWREQCEAVTRLLAQMGLTDGAGPGSRGEDAAEDRGGDVVGQSPE